MGLTVDCYCAKLSYKRKHFITSALGWFQMLINWKPDCFPRLKVLQSKKVEIKFYYFSCCPTAPWWVQLMNKMNTNIPCYYSTNCNTIQIWSWCSRYLSSVGNVYPAIYVASYVGRKSEVKKMSTERFKNVTSFVINLLNNKTIILLNLAEYRLILADSAYGLVG